MCIGVISRTSLITSHIVLVDRELLPLIIEITLNWSCQLNNLCSLYPIITKFRQLTLAALIFGRLLSFTFLPVFSVLNVFIICLQKKMVTVMRFYRNVCQHMHLEFCNYSSQGSVELWPFTYIKECGKIMLHVYRFLF